MRVIDRIDRSEARLRPVAGVTLIELIVSVFVLSVLMALLLSAVQGAREAARRVQCAGNLRQIGLALQAYVASQNSFPGIVGQTIHSGSASTTGSAHSYSVFARLLAELEQVPLYNDTNFYWTPASAQALNDNRTVMMIGLDVLLCPSDSARPPKGYGRANYRVSTGPSPWHAPGDSAPQSWDGPFTAHRFYRPQDFRDGLAHTIGASERIQGDWISDRISRGDYRLGPGFVKPLGNPDWATAKCAGAPPSWTVESRAGESWFLSGLHFTNYNHCNTPNHSSLDCGFYEYNETVLDRSRQSGVFAARSNHSGGVNTLLMDGGVRFTRNEIALQVWRALGTRSGGETLTE